MEVPQDLGKCKQYPKDSCVASEYQPNTSSKKPSMTSRCWGTIQFSVYCPNWETLRAKEVPWITMLNNGHRPGLSQGIRLCGQPTSRQSWPLSSLNSQSTSVCSLHSVCLRCQFPNLSENFTKTRSGLFYLHHQRLSRARHRDDTEYHQWKQMFI